MVLAERFDGCRYSPYANDLLICQLAYANEQNTLHLTFDLIVSASRSQFVAFQGSAKFVFTGPHVTRVMQIEQTGAASRSLNRRVVFPPINCNVMSEKWRTTQIVNRLRHQVICPMIVKLLDIRSSSKIVFKLFILIVLLFKHFKLEPFQYLLAGVVKTCQN